MKNFLYFRPEYFARFKCDGSKCNARCCKQWKISVDKKTFAQYSKLGDEIVRHMQLADDSYRVTLNEKNFCPFLTENNLCRIQLEHGENFLSETCATYPRKIYDFGKFFECSLMLTCPVAAEMILFNPEPMSFEFVQLPEEIHSRNRQIKGVRFTEGLAERMLEIQIAMISILQERNFSISQRLIVLGFFIDKLDEMTTGKFFSEAEVSVLIDDLTKLIAAYESKSFWAEQVPLMLASVRFDEKKFSDVMNALANEIPDEIISVAGLIANREKFFFARKNFMRRYSIFMENFLVNEIFLNCYPWRFESNLLDNFAFFLTTYKIFELTIFSIVQAGPYSHQNILELVDWFTMITDHSEYLHEKISDALEDKDLFTLMESLLER